ncbi:hypothetical protein [Sulfurimonas sp.]|uniref:hypothetical protein n=1 Tax=Sulfurimonas sp. TaxID=2022749 RepID=UPI0026162D4A|nr:hypothetical protein [Sulfurimonas sp.]MDD5156826.1 hypothetical protein [Sulfurimonas sp.]
MKEIENNIEYIGSLLFSREVGIEKFMEITKSLSTRMIELSIEVSREINLLLNPDSSYLKNYPLRNNIKTSLEYYNIFEKGTFFNDELDKQMFLNIDIYKIKPLFLSNVFFYSLLELYKKEDNIKIKKAIKSLISLLYKKFLTFDIWHIVIEPKPLDKEEVSARTRSSATTRISCILSDSYKYYWIRIDLPHIGQDKFHLNIEELSQFGDSIGSLTNSEMHTPIDELNIEPGINPFNEIENYLITAIPYGNYLVSTIKDDFNIKKELLRYHLLSLISIKLYKNKSSEWPKGELNQMIQQLLEEYPYHEEYSESDYNTAEIWHLLGEEILKDA